MAIVITRRGIRKVLAAGESSNAKRDSVVLNAGVALYVYGSAKTIKMALS